MNFKTWILAWALIALFVKGGLSGIGTTIPKWNSESLQESYSREKISFDLQEEELILNLNEYLSPFRKCLVQLINYKRINFRPFQHPVTIVSSTQFLIERFPGNPLWKCRIQFNLLPPYPFTVEQPFRPESRPHVLRYVEPGKILLDDYHKSLAGRYLVILDRPGAIRNSIWLKIMDNAVGIGSQSNKLVLTTSKPKNEGLSINCLLLVCHYCNKRFKTFIPFSPCKSHAETFMPRRLELDSRIANINTPNGRGPWYIDYLHVSFWKAQRQHQMLAHLEKIRGVTFSNVPWLRHKGVLMDTVLIQIAIQNFTLVDRKCNVMKSDECDLLGQNAPSLILTPSVLFFTGNEEKLTFLAVETHGCEMVRRNSWLSIFHIYIHPYDFKSWIYIMLCFIGLGALLWAVSKKYVIKESLKTKCLPFFMGLRLLLDQGDDNVRYSIELGFLSWVCAAWALMAIVINSAYKDIVMLELVAPLKPQGPHNFRDLEGMNFDIYRGFRTHLEHKNLMDSLKEQMKASQAKVKEYDAGDKDFDSFPESKDFFRAFNDVIDKGFLKESDYNGGTFDPEFDLVVSGQISMTDYDFSSKSFCSRKAYVGWSTEIEKLLINQMIKNPYQRDLDFFKSGDSKGKRKIGWDIQNWGESGIIRRIKAMIESGIADKWRQMEKERVVDKDDMLMKRIIRPLTLDDQSATVFNIFGACALISTFVFVIEARHKIWKMLKLFWKICRFCRAFYFGVSRRTSKVFVPQK